MSEKYFKKFPTTVYNGVNCVDITKRVALNPEIRDNIDLYYPIEVEAGFRPDALSEAYYEDSELEWLLYLSNQIVDPYYEWYISEKNFADLIIKKYGSIATAQEKIKYYRNNWYTDSNEITVSQYNNTIDQTTKKYYEPIFGPKNKIISYRRKQKDWVMNTNKILQYTISLANSEVGFTNGEIVDIKSSGEIVGGGEAVVANSTHLIVQHVSGNTSANSTATKTIIGESSAANGTANAVTTLQENITNSEIVFWSNVSYYDWELEKYESRKYVDVVDESMVIDISEEVTLKLNET